VIVARPFRPRWAAAVLGKKIADGRIAIAHRGPRDVAEWSMVEESGRSEHVSPNVTASRPVRSCEPGAGPNGRDEIIKFAQSGDDAPRAMMPKCGRSGWRFFSPRIAKKLQQFGMGADPDRHHGPTRGLQGGRVPFRRARSPLGRGCSESDWSEGRRSDGPRTEPWGGASGSCGVASWPRSARHEAEPAVSGSRSPRPSRCAMNPAGTHPQPETRSLWSWLEGGKSLELHHRILGRS
jgi:hypothetical protein